MAVGGRASGDGDAGRVIAAVLQAAQAFDDDRHDRFGTYIANDSAHAEKCRWRVWILMREIAQSSPGAMVRSGEAGRSVL